MYIARRSVVQLQLILNMEHAIKIQINVETFNITCSVFSQTSFITVSIEYIQIVFFSFLFFLIIDKGLSLIVARCFLASVCLMVVSAAPAADQTLVQSGIFK